MNTTYTPVAKSLHWLMALLILGLLVLGTYMSDLPLSPQKLELYAWHKWAGGARRARPGAARPAGRR